MVSDPMLYRGSQFSGVTSGGGVNLQKSQSQQIVPFEQVAQNRWTPERLKKLTGKKKLLIMPHTHFQLLQAIGLMNSDASISADQVKKFLQINHMVTLIWPLLEDLRKTMPGQSLCLLDVGCGNSYLGLALAFHWKETYGEQGLVLHGVDLNPKVINASSSRSIELGLEKLTVFHCGSLQKAENIAESQMVLDADLYAPPLKTSATSSQDVHIDLPERIHGVLALHACDKATDEALAFGLSRKADWMAVVPCCQAELAQSLAKQSAENIKTPLAVLFNSPQLRRESAATLTDGLRIALVRALGYEVTATEFIPSNHTPKNRLIVCLRRGNYHKPAYLEYLELRNLLGGPSLELEKLVKALIAKQPLD